MPKMAITILWLTCGAFGQGRYKAIDRHNLDNTLGISECAANTMSSWCRINLICVCGACHGIFYCLLHVYKTARTWLVKSQYYCVVCLLSFIQLLWPYSVITAPTKSLCSLAHLVSTQDFTLKWNNRKLSNHHENCSYHTLNPNWLLSKKNIFVEYFCVFAKFLVDNFRIYYKYPPCDYVC